MTSILKRVILCGAHVVLAGFSAAAAPTEKVIHNNYWSNMGAGVAVSETGAVYGYQADPFPNSNKNQGVMYQLSQPKTAHPPFWYTTYIHTFGGVGDGSQPVGAPVYVRGQGTIYGVTATGGAFGQGVAFQLKRSAPGSAIWNETLLHSFGPADGVGSFTSGGSIMAGANGVLYGTTINPNSGPCLGSCGSVFSLTPPASGQGDWTYQTIYAFLGGADGFYPAAPLVQDSTGALYGSTQFGGSDTTSCYDRQGCGTIFKLAPPGQGQSAWTKTILYSFPASSPGQAGPNGGQPVGSLTLGADGLIYGTAKFGGMNCTVGGGGVAFYLDTTDKRKTNPAYAVIHDFSCSGEGIYPNGGLIVGGNNSLLGTTQASSSVAGAVFRLIAPTSGVQNWSLSILHGFHEFTTDGAIPNAPLTRAPNGYLVGTTLLGGGGKGAGVGTTFEVYP